MTEPFTALRAWVLDLCQWCGVDLNFAAPRSSCDECEGLYIRNHCVACHPFIVGDEPDGAT